MTAGSAASSQAENNIHEPSAVYTARLAAPSIDERAFFFFFFVFMWPSPDDV